MVDPSAEGSSARAEALQKANAETGQRGASWHLPVPDGLAAKVPVWTSRTEWLRQVDALLADVPGRALLAMHHTTAEVAAAYATAWAATADSATGRGITEARARTARRAGLSATVARRARRVLRDVGLAVELATGRYLTLDERELATAHHGDRQLRAASSWALTTPAAVAAAVPPAPKPPRTRRARHGRRHTRPSTRPTQPVDPSSTRSSDPRGPLPQRGAVGLCPSVLGISPTHASACGRAPRRSLHDHEPKALQTQRVAAELVQRVPALAGGRHIGLVCDALTAAGVDGSRWRGRDVQARLDADTRARGWSWPAQLTSPVGFLRHRLLLLDWSVPSPVEVAGAERARRAARAAREAAERAVAAPVASAGARAAARAWVAARVGPGTGRVRSRAGWAVEGSPAPSPRTGPAPPPT